MAVEKKRFQARSAQSKVHVGSYIIAILNTLSEPKYPVTQKLNLDLPQRLFTFDEQTFFHQ